MKLSTARIRSAGTTLTETVVAAALVAGFFGSIFEVNAVCLRYINATKQNVAAMQGVQDRLESLRSLTFANLTSASTVQTLMTTPSNSSDLSAKVTEVVTMSAFPTPDGTNTVITRGPGASVTPTINSTDSSLSSATLVKVTVTYTWTMSLTGRSMSESTETIIASGNKKA